MKIIIDIIGVLLELIISVWSFDATMSRNEDKTKLFYTISGIFIVANTGAVSVFGSGLSLMITLAITIYLLSTLYNQSILIKSVWVIFLVAISALGELLTGIAATLVLNISVEILRNNLFFYFYGVLMSKLLFLVFLFPIRARTWKVNSFTKKKWFILFACMPLSSMTVIISVLDLAITITDKKTLLFMLGAIIFLTTSNLMAFFLTERYVLLESEKTETQLRQQQLLNQADYYRKLAEDYRQSSLVMHDVKNSLFATLSQLHDQEYCHVEERIRELCNSALAPYESQLTANDAINALLSSKLHKMKELDIIFTHKIILSSINEIIDQDLCVLLGNALDNATEACEKITLNDQRKIRLLLEQRKDKLLIEVLNSVVVSSDVNLQNNKLKSTKSNKLIHGFGIENMKVIARKYNGDISFIQEGSKFLVRAVLENVLPESI